MLKKVKWNECLLLCVRGVSYGHPFQATVIVCESTQKPWRTEYCVYCTSYARTNRQTKQKSFLISFSATHNYHHHHHLGKERKWEENNQMRFLQSIRESLEMKSKKCWKWWWCRCKWEGFLENQTFSLFKYQLHATFTILIERKWNIKNLKSPSSILSLSIDDGDVYLSGKPKKIIIPWLGVNKVDEKMRTMMIIPRGKTAMTFAEAFEKLTPLCQLFLGEIITTQLGLWIHLNVPCLTNKTFRSNTKRSELRSFCMSRCNL